MPAFKPGLALTEALLVLGLCAATMAAIAGWLTEDLAPLAELLGLH
ncbi:hypothetical protein [Massilia sp. TS11]|nr:hypothetical protein [Massilia sp. TS11]MCG2584449.1 hypothetical protein [Massilia sp. TS11]